MYSEHYNNLNSEMKTRYLKKIDVICGIDPYMLTNVSLDVYNFPKITYVDIVNYLVFERSFYTMEEFKTYKSLTSYNQFLCGWVKEIAAKKIRDDICVVVGKVLHSQKLKEKQLAVWIIAKLDGQILSAHCTCVAGLGETCSHVGALLFAIDDNVRNLETRSVTGVKAYWKVPSTRPGAPCTSKTIDYSSASKLFKIAKGEIQISHRSKITGEAVPIAKNDEVLEHLQILKENELGCSLFSAVKPFCEDFNQPLTNKLANLYNNKYKTEELAALIAVGQKINSALTDEQCKYIEYVTRRQSKCVAWFEFRLGRITASIFKACVSTKIENPSISLLRKVCYPTTRFFKNAATTYGCTHESDAIKSFSSFMTNHANCKLTDVGFVLNPRFPEVGASPDSLVDCDCCEAACLEVKCPFCARDLSIAEATLLKNFCLKKDDKYFLPQSHHYYYQCQMQMAVTERRFCYFVVWTKNDMYVEKIPFNQEFWHGNYKRAKIFFSDVIMPELLGKFYTNKKQVTKSINNYESLLPKIHVGMEQQAASSSSSTQLYCLCQKPDDGKPMIVCDGANCRIEWYHMSCVGIEAEQIPAKWFCHYCAE